jgi:hypothetical protein
MVMSAKHPLLRLVVLSSVLAGACAQMAAATPVSPTAASGSTRAPMPAAARAIAAPAKSLAVGERFAQPDQTVEYHFMIQVTALSEADLERSYQASVVKPLKAVADAGALGRCRPGAYIDSKGRDLAKHNLIVRVRDGQITIKARAASPAALLDLEGCASRKYELDQFGTPEYSISSEISLGAGGFDIARAGVTPAAVWDSIEGKCPRAWNQLRSVVRGSGKMEIPGVAHMYSAEATLRHPAGADVKEASVAVWFFPPTDRFLVELAFTGFVKDRAEMDRMYTELGAALRAAGLLSADQSSKTRQYFAAYFGPGTQRTRKPR